MMDDPTRARQHGSGGLCDRCRHRSIIESARGSRFLLCRQSMVDPRLPKYPRLPVVACHAFDEGDADWPLAGDRRAGQSDPDE